MNTNEKKLDNIKKTLMELSGQIPDQFALENVKSNLRKTIASINEVQNKRQKKYQQQTQNETQNKIGFMSSDDAKKALEILDQMLKSEQKSIDKMQKQKEASSSPTLLTD